MFAKDETTNKKYDAFWGQVLDSILLLALRLLAGYALCVYVYKKYDAFWGQGAMAGVLGGR
eukprot:1304763-Rhodomonas_salina.1